MGCNMCPIVFSSGQDFALFPPLLTHLKDLLEDICNMALESPADCVPQENKSESSGRRAEEIKHRNSNFCVRS